MQGCIGRVTSSVSDSKNSKSDCSPLWSALCLTSQAALYCLEEEEAPLLQYLANARDSQGKPLYDPQTALRLARQRNKLQACVQLLCDLNLYEVRASSLTIEVSKISV